MDEILIKLCCQEFDTFEDAMRANPYRSGHSIRYRLRNNTLLGLNHESALEVRRLASGKFAWVSILDEDARLVDAIKQLIKAESEKAVLAYRRSLAAK
jgi:hypothetical protein